MVRLVAGDRATRHRPENAVDRAIVVALLGERALRIAYHISRRQIVISVDRAVECVVAVVRIVAVGRIPPAIVPVIIAAPVEDDAIVIARPPGTIVSFTPPVTPGVGVVCVS